MDNQKNFNVDGEGCSEHVFLFTQLKLAQVVTALLVEQCCNNAVIMAEQCCWTNNVVNYCFNNVVQHWWSSNGCSRLLEQEKAKIDRTIKLVRYCYYCCSTLLTSCNSIDGWTMVVTTLFSWLNNLIDNIVHGVQNNIVHDCWQLAAGCAFLRVYV